MTSENAQEPAAAPVAAPANQQSSIEFPYCDLDSAVELARGVHNAGGMACEAEQLAAHVGMEAKGGGFRVRLIGTKMFGFLTYERGGRITLTELGRRIIEPEKERSARIDAFLTVPLYSRVYEHFKGGPLPPQSALDRSLATLGVGNGVKEKARQVFMRSAKQAGFFELAADRLTKPVVRQEPGSPEKTEKQPPEDTKKNDGNGGGDHPLIQGLLLTLPTPGVEWPIEDRFNWLNMANSIFKMVYKAANTDADVEVRHTKKQ